MNRRNFIRVAGGGIVSAATVTGLSGCALSSAFPPQALEAWAGPGAEPDLRRWALGYAILAPNSHNRQPWLVDLSQPNAITLYVDRSRMLPMTDPWFRQIVVSQGTLLEALALALRERGLRPEVQLFPQGEFKAREVDDRPVARVSWAGDAAPIGSRASPASPALLLAPAPGKDPLFAQLLRRHTARVDYDTTRTVAPATLDALQSVLNDPDVAVAGVKFGGTIDAARLEPLRTLCWESARTELLTTRTVMESVKLTRVGPAEIAQHRDGISVNGWLPRIASSVGAFDRTAPPLEGSTAYKQMMGRFEGHSRTAMGFVWLSTPTAHHATAGVAGVFEDVRRVAAQPRVLLRQVDSSAWRLFLPRTWGSPAVVSAWLLRQQVGQPLQGMLNRRGAHGCAVTVKVLHFGHHARRRRKSKPHRAHRLGRTAARGAGHAGHRHRDLRAGMGDGALHHGADHLFADCAVLFDQGCVHSQHVCFGFVRIGDKATFKPGAGACQVGAGSGDHAAGATFGGGQHLPIFEH